MTVPKAVEGAHRRRDRENPAFTPVPPPYLARPFPVSNPDSSAWES